MVQLTSVDVQLTSLLTRKSSLFLRKGYIYYTFIPLKLYFKKNLLKVELGVCRGKKNYDKRQTIKERDIKRNIEKQMK